MTCVDFAPRTSGVSAATRLAVLASAAALAGAVAAAVWSAHPAELRRLGAETDHALGGVPAQSAYVIAKIGVVPAERSATDIPYVR